jgi:hypothetical protein
MEEIDRVFRQAARNRRPNEEAAKRVEIVSGEFSGYAELADAVLRS